MDLLKSVTQSVLGASHNTSEYNGADTVEKLVDRVQSCTLLEDRKDGCRALKAVSRKFRIHVGAHGMDTLIKIMETDRNDHEIINYALETLINITSPEIHSEELDERASSESNVGEQFTEMFIKKVENIAIVLDLLDEFDFKVKFPAIRLLKNLAENRYKEVQEAVLVIPQSIPKLMDQLADSREVIRNEMLLLLTLITRGNTSLQKIVAFENIFDQIFAILDEEEYANGGVVTEDCLNFLLVLLSNNPSNQILFKEGHYISNLSKFLCDSTDYCEVDWTMQKVSNISSLLKLVSALVSPHNPAQVVSACQKEMSSRGLLQSLCCLLMAFGVPSDILSDTLLAVSELIRGCSVNQEYFSKVMTPSTPSRPAIVALLMSMVNSKQPFSLRCGVLYCFQCFLYKNPKGQAQVIQTLLPQTAEAGQLTAGQLLCGGLFSSEPASNWLSAIALSHTLIDNKTLKEQLFRVQLATRVGSSAVSLMQQCISMLQSSSSIYTRLGILQFLSIWLAYCPLAVSQFLILPHVISHLTAHLSAVEHDEQEILYQGICAFILSLCAHFNDGSVANLNREALTRLVSNRIGEEVFRDKISHVSSSEAYSRAAKNPYLKAKELKELVFDEEFTKLFRSLEYAAVNSISAKDTGKDLHNNGGADISHYEDVIHSQHCQMSELRQQLLEASKTAEENIKEKNNLLAKIETLQQALQESNLHKIAEKIDGAVTQVSLGQVPQANDNSIECYCDMKPDEKLELCSRPECKLKVELVKQEEEDLLILLTEQQNKIDYYRTKLRELGASVSDDEDNYDSSDS